MRILILLLAVTAALFLTSGCKTPAAPAAPRQGTVTLLLTPKTRPETIIAAFPDYGLSAAVRASRSQNKYRFNYQTPAGKADGMRAALTAHEAVIEVWLH